MLFWLESGVFKLGSWNFQPEACDGYRAVSIGEKHWKTRSAWCRGSKFGAVTRHFYISISEHIDT